MHHHGASAQFADLGSIESGEQRAELTGCGFKLGAIGDRDVSNKAAAAVFTPSAADEVGPARGAGRDR